MRICPSDREIIADNTYVLNPKTFLFAILASEEHLKEDIVRITERDFDIISRRIINTGRPTCFLTYPIHEGLARLPFVSMENGEYIVDTQKMLEEFIYTDKEKRFLDECIQLTGDYGQYKIYAMFCILKVDTRLLEDKVTEIDVLNCGFFEFEPNNYTRRKIHN